MAKPLKTALIYDFDGTLARGNMQEVTFIPSVGMGIGDFWGAADTLTREADGDNILTLPQRPGVFQSLPGSMRTSVLSLRT